MNATTQLHDLGQSIWIDNITRQMLNDGTLQRYIQKLHLTGLTSNPTIFNHAIRNSHDYDQEIAQKKREGNSGEALVFELAVSDLRRAADLFRPVHERTHGVDGWVSLEVPPALTHDAKATIEAVKQLNAQGDRSNLYIKIPGTTEGLLAIEESIFDGIPINVTLLFSREQYLAAADAFLRGIERRVDAGFDPVVHSVASIFVSRWDVAVHDKAPKELKCQLGIAVAEQAYEAYRSLLNSPRWLRLQNMGARPQRLLWASTGTKDPEASETLYVEALAAPMTVNTMPDATLKAVADHGQIRHSLSGHSAGRNQVFGEFSKLDINVDALAATLQEEGAKSFEKSWNELLDALNSKSEDVKKAG